MKPFSLPALEEIIRDELAELAFRPECPRTKEEIQQTFRLYGRAVKPAQDWQPVK